MTGILNLLAGAVSSAIKDTYFNLTTLLLPGDGTNGAQNNTFLDSSSNNFTITRNGNTTQGTFSPFSQTGWGNYFDGTDDYLSVADNAVLRPGAGVFTLEAWIYRGASGAAHTIYAKGGASTGIVFQVASTNVLRFTHTTTNIDSTGTIASNSWVHVAVVREGTGTNQTKLYINGTQDGQGTVSTDFTQTEQVRIGTDRSAAADFNGYISNLRFTKGAALYTGNFTPATSPLTTTSQGASSADVELLTCQSNRFIDNSSNAFAITVNGTPSVQAFSPFAPSGAYTTTAVGGSGYFDGNGDYLSTTYDTATQFGSGNFTIEAWIYPTANGSASGNIFQQQNFQVNLNSHLSAMVFRQTDGGIFFAWCSGNTQYNATTSANAALLNTWTHVACVRSGDTFTVYVNGVSSATNTTAVTLNTISSSPTNNIGMYIENASVTPVYYPFNGYISNLRVNKGTAVYTGAFTPPLAPLSTSGEASASAYPSTTNVNTTFAASSTGLLLNFTNAGITDATAKNDLETVGNAQISTTQSKFGGSSMYFDGTGDGLVLPASPFYNFLDGNFTVEAWVYIAGNSPLDGLSRRIANIFSVSTSSAFSFNFVIRGDGTTTGTGLEIYNGTNIVNVTGTISQNTWHHIAVTKSGTSVYFFLNGTQMGTTQTTSGNWGSATVAAQVGRTAVTSYTFDLNGYVDDLRVTRFARYTANFTPPTAAFALQ